MSKDMLKRLFVTIIISICTGLILSIICFKLGNKQLIDLQNTYNKCIIFIGDEKIELKVKSWKDYEGEQIQIIDDKGTVYLVSMDNAILIKEK